MATMTESTTLDGFVDLIGSPTGGLDGTDAERVRHAITRLGPRYQRAIGLRYLADLDHEAAASAMGLAKPAFAVVLSRALKALRREFDRIDDENPDGRAYDPRSVRSTAQDGGTT